LIWSLGNIVAEAGGILRGGQYPRMLGRGRFANGSLNNGNSDDEESCGEVTRGGGGTVPGNALQGGKLREGESPG